MIRRSIPPLRDLTLALLALLSACRSAPDPESWCYDASAEVRCLGATDDTCYCRYGPCRTDPDCDVSRQFCGNGKCVDLSGYCDARARAQLEVHARCGSTSSTGTCTGVLRPYASNPWPCPSAAFCGGGFCCPTSAPFLSATDNQCYSACPSNGGQECTCFDANGNYRC